MGFKQHPPTAPVAAVVRLRPDRDSARGRCRWRRRSRTRRTATLWAPCRTSNCGIAENIPTIPAASGKATGLVASRSVLTCDPMTGMPAASSTGQITSLSSADMPTTATTCWSTARSAHLLSLRRVRLRVAHDHLHLWCVAPAASSITAHTGAHSDTYSTAAGHCGLAKNSPMVITTNRSPSTVTAVSVGMTGTDRGDDDSRRDQRGHDAPAPRSETGRTMTRQGIPLCPLVAPPRTRVVGVSWRPLDRHLLGGSRSRARSGIRTHMPRRAAGF